jgi:hypothetical protein
MSLSVSPKASLFVLNSKKSFGAAFSLFIERITNKNVYFG